jgi:hypothetical protein
MLSFSAGPSFPVSDVRSDPARSTSYNLLVVILPDSSIISTMRVINECDRELAMLRLCDPMILFFTPELKYPIASVGVPI